MPLTPNVGEGGRAGRDLHLHVDPVPAEGQLGPIIRANISKEANFMTDEARHYMEIGREFASHGAVNHGEKEYVRGKITTNKATIRYSNAA